MKNPFTTLKQIFAEFGKRLGKKIKSKVETKPAEQLKIESQSPFEHHEKTGGTPFQHANELLAKYKIKRRIKARITKRSRGINYNSY